MHSQNRREQHQPLSPPPEQYDSNSTFGNPRPGPLAEKSLNTGSRNDIFYRVHTEHRGGGGGTQDPKAVSGKRRSSVATISPESPTVLSCNATPKSGKGTFSVQTKIAVAGAMRALQQNIRLLHEEIARLKRDGAAEEKRHREAERAVRAEAAAMEKELVAALAAGKEREEQCRVLSQLQDKSNQTVADLTKRLDQMADKLSEKEQALEQQKQLAKDRETRVAKEKRCCEILKERIRLMEGEKAKLAAELVKVFHLFRIPSVECEGNAPIAIRGVAG